tara:strand:- start:865 stop:1461 length:597 start_codon:yes stop_codon:yes gene_type:complete
MRNPEIRQKGESREDYVRRISKLPIISPNTILRAVFPTVSQDTLRYIKDCARPVFPKAFPPEDSNGTPYLNPEKISTKEFAKWVAEEDIFEALIGLGEKPSPIAELFIDLVLGKTDTPAKHSAKTKPNLGRWAENNKQKEAARKAAKKLWKQNKDLTIADVIRHDDINKVAPNKAESTLRSWIKDLAPSNKPGRPKKK